MTDTNLLKSKMVAVGDENFVECIAGLIVCSRTTASRKLYGENEFTQGEIAIIAEKYNLTSDEINRIFIGVD